MCPSGYEEVESAPSISKPATIRFCTGPVDHRCNKHVVAVYVQIQTYLETVLPLKVARSAARPCVVRYFPNRPEARNVSGTRVEKRVRVESNEKYAVRKAANERTTAEREGRGVARDTQLVGEEKECCVWRKRKERPPCLPAS